ncbi:MAG: hypothetical protein K8T25_09870 [Planctomycetia bacterium]|nr:hypothetical protein [Planctomycetia bacterium]
MWIILMRQFSNRLARVRTFAHALGWSDVRECRHTFPKDIQPQYPYKTLVWFEVGEFPDCFLQINLRGGWKAAVYAVKYRICTGWHPFVLGRTEKRLTREAERLNEWLALAWFSSPAKRRKFRLLHPECANYSWPKIRREGVPIRQRFEA